MSESSHWFFVDNLNSRDAISRRLTSLNHNVTSSSSKKVFIAFVSGCLIKATDMTYKPSFSEEYLLSLIEDLGLVVTAIEVSGGGEKLKLGDEIKLSNLKKIFSAIENLFIACTKKGLISYIKGDMWIYAPFINIFEDEFVSNLLLSRLRDITFDKK